MSSIINQQTKEKDSWNPNNQTLDVWRQHWYARELILVIPHNISKIYWEFRYMNVGIFRRLPTEKTQHTLFLGHSDPSIFSSDKLSCILLKTSAICSDLPTEISIQPSHQVFD